MMPNHYRMPPAYIRLLMSLYVSPQPFEDYGSYQQIVAPITKAAVAFFEKHGLLAVGVTYDVLLYEYEQARGLLNPPLSPKGEALVNRICNTSFHDL